jgi:hypothetical protein
LKRLTGSAEKCHRAPANRAFVASVAGKPRHNADQERIASWREWILSQVDKLDLIATGRIWDDVNDGA